MISKPIYIDLKYGFVVFTTLVSIQLWSFTGLDDFVYSVLEMLVLFGLFYFLLVNRLNHKKLVFRNNVILFICIPLLSSLGAFVFHEQSFGLSLLALRTNFFWLLYIVLHILDIPVRKIINLMIFVGLVWIFLTVIQQFTFPTYYFATKNENETYYFLRAGVYRFMLNRHHYGVFIVLFFFYNFLITKRLYNLYFVAIGLVGFYYYGTRQFAVAVLACMGYTMFLIKGRSRFLAISSLAACVFLLLMYKDTLFGEYLEMTNNQLEKDDDIRLIAAHFFFYDYWPHWFAMVTGNGIPHYLSSYGMEVNDLKVTYRLFRSDVGIIGAFNQYGILYIVNILWLIIKGLRNRYYTPKTKYLKLIFLNLLILLPLSEFFGNGSAIPFFCFILYLVDKSFENKHEEEADDLEEPEEEKYLENTRTEEVTA